MDVPSATSDVVFLVVWRDEGRAVRHPVGHVHGGRGTRRAHVSARTTAALPCEYPGPTRVAVQVVTDMFLAVHLTSAFGAPTSRWKGGEGTVLAGAPVVHTLAHHRRRHLCRGVLCRSHKEIRWEDVTVDPGNRGWPVVLGEGGPHHHPASGSWGGHHHSAVHLWCGPPSARNLHDIALAPVGPVRSLRPFFTPTTAYSFAIDVWWSRAGPRYSSRVALLRCKRSPPPHQDAFLSSVFVLLQGGKEARGSSPPFQSCAATGASLSYLGCIHDAATIAWKDPHPTHRSTSTYSLFLVLFLLVVSQVRTYVECGAKSHKGPTASSVQEAVSIRERLGASTIAVGRSQRGFC